MKFIHTILPILFSIAAFAQESAMLPDESIERALQNRIYLSQEVDADDLTIEVEDAVALLQGEVSTYYEKEKAREIAGTTKGVVSVVDDVIVDVPYKTDENLKEDVEQALIVDPTTEGFEVEVKVEEGHVKLYGQVSSLAEVRLAKDVTLSVKGVKSVDSHLTIKSTQGRKDIDIQYDIIGLIEHDSRVAPKDLNVDVDQGVVKLEGKVGTPYEVEVMKALSEVEGATSVETDGLVVDAQYDKYWLKDDASKRSIVSDSSIAAAVKEVFEQDARIDADELTVSVEDANVTLSGDVDNLRIRRVAEDRANNVVGVRLVENHIKVIPSEMEASILRAKVKNAIMKNPLLEGQQVHVDVDNGIVVLSGTVESNFLRYIAENQASSVDGVIAVTNQLESAYYPGYYTHSTRYELTEADRSVVEKRAPDAMIEQDILYQLLWSPYVDHEDIEVEVNRGVAVISGEVSSMREHKAIVSNAYEAGAVAVVAELELE